jgi:hypothetical protein
MISTTTTKVNGIQKGDKTHGQSIKLANLSKTNIKPSIVKKLGPL